MRAHAAAAREAERARRAYERAAAQDERERKRLYQEARAADVAADNEALDGRMAALETVLASGLARDPHIELGRLKQAPAYPTWQHTHLEAPSAAPTLDLFLPPPATGMAKMFGGKKHDAAVAAAHEAFAQAQAAHAQQEAQRVAWLDQARAAFGQERQRAEQVAAEHNSGIDAWAAELAAGDPDAVVSYLDMVLQASDYPDDFPRSFKIAYVPVSRQEVVEYELPGPSIVPSTKAYRYVKTTDSVTETARPRVQIVATYASVVAQLTLRTVSEIFRAERGQHIDVVVFNGMLSSIDPGTGQPVRPCVISLRATRETFSALDLGNVDPMACLKHLSASVSRSPAELVPVRPVLEFSMVDPRFVAESDVLSGLDQRPNLMELSPTEFEGLIQNLFTKMGLDTKQTRPSRDGGVDCVAFDTRAILGGKVVIQAKRYKNTVGVSAVRDLFGTVMNEGASKGILVTTSGYGRGAFDFARDKPLELLDGANLLALLAEHAGIEAKIVPPDAWADPTPDSLEWEPAGVSDVIPQPLDTTPNDVNNVEALPTNLNDQEATADGVADAGSTCTNPACSNYGVSISARQCPVCFHYARA